MFQPGAVLNTQSFGNRPEGVEVPHVDVRAPNSGDVHTVGKIWLYLANSVWYNLNNTSTGTGTLSNWVQLAGASGNILSIVGTANQITVTTTAGVATLSIPSTFVAPGSITATTTLTATLGNITATNGNLNLATAGNKLLIATGSNASTGVSGVMSGTPGAVTVATTACTASSVILYSRATTGGTPGQVSITAQSGTGFTLTSTGNETSTFNWLIIN